MADLTDEYWADDRAAFEAAMAEGGEDLNCAKCGLVGIEHAYKNDRTRLLYFAWASGREHERAANTKPASEPVQDAASIAIHTAGAAGPAREPLAWLYEDTLPDSYPYDEMFQHSEVRSGVRMFPVFGPPAIEANDAKDAARYRWLREQDWFSGTLCVLRDPKRVLTSGIGLGADCPSHHRLDAAIDAAMSTHQSAAAGVPGTFNDQGEK